jgi:hypothetical protein
LSGAATGKRGEAETLRCREMMKSHDSSESESEPEEEEVRREQEEKSRSKKGPSSSSPLSRWYSEATDVSVSAARRAARSRRICILRRDEELARRARCCGVV